MEKTCVAGFLSYFFLERRHDERHSIGILWRRTVARGTLFFPFWQGEALLLTDEEMDKALTGELPFLDAETGERQYAQLGYAAAPPDLGLVLVFSPSRFR